MWPRGSAGDYPAPVTLAAPTRPRAWLRRYLPAELAGTAVAVGAGLAAHAGTGSTAAAALTGAAAETVAYYGWFAGVELRHHWRALAGAPRRTGTALRRTGRDLAVEFGAAEALDTLARPALMYAGPLVVPPVGLGLLAGKIAADLVFYALAITGYELRQRRIRPRDGVPT